jgi:uncharacterized membrane protein
MTQVSVLVLASIGIHMHSVAPAAVTYSAIELVHDMETPLLEMDVLTVVDKPLHQFAGHWIENEL